MDDLATRLLVKHDDELTRILTTLASVVPTQEILVKAREEEHARIKALELRIAAIEACNERETTA